MLKYSLNCHLPRCTLYSYFSWQRFSYADWGLVYQLVCYCNSVLWIENRCYLSQRHGINICVYICIQARNCHIIFARASRKTICYFWQSKFLCNIFFVLKDRHRLARYFCQTFFCLRTETKRLGKRLYANLSGNARGNNSCEANCIAMYTIFRIFHGSQIALITYPERDFYAITSTFFDNYWLLFKLRNIPYIKSHC